MLRGSDLTRLMVTLGVALMLRELANRFSDITGGADGLQGIMIAPVLGLFDFDLFGQTAYHLLPRRAVRAVPARAAHRAFALRPVAAGDPQAIRCAPPPIGIPVNRAARRDLHARRGLCRRRRRAADADRPHFVSLDVFAFHRSADVLLVLVIGGVGYLYGGLIGAVIFKVLQDCLSTLTPQYWQFWIGLILVVIVLVGRERIGASFGRMPGAGLGRR